MSNKKSFMTTSLLSLPSVDGWDLINAFLHHTIIISLDFQCFELQPHTLKSWAFACLINSTLNWWLKYPSCSCNDCQLKLHSLHCLIFTYSIRIHLFFPTALPVPNCAFPSPRTHPFSHLPISTEHTAYKISGNGSFKNELICFKQ